MGPCARGALIRPLRGRPSRVGWATRSVPTQRKTQCGHAEPVVGPAKGWGGFANPWFFGIDLPASALPEHALASNHPDTSARRRRHSFARRYIACDHVPYRRTLGVLIYASPAGNDIFAVWIKRRTGSQ